ncbi:MAG: peptidoglycan DD-metalloendopeptidase family protein [Bacteroidetes bacterium]|nr:peptidoglycan DD-metalloendopeptidase family protein [Bacteroidota bacterium]
MKFLKHITVLAAAFLICTLNCRAENISVANSFTVTLADTAGVSSISSDTAQPTATDLASVDTNVVDPPAANTVTAVNTGEGIDETPASDLYDDFDTTIVHAEKFDALTFDDTVFIPLKDPSHCDFVMPVNGPMTSTFAFRSYRYHLGVDLDLEIGDSVKCAFDGKVRIAQKSKTYGYVVVVRHANGLETYYAHLSKLLVHPNQELEAGDVLGLGGNTGHSFGSHLHFEIRFRGQPIDPNYLIDFKNGVLRTDTYCLCKSDFKYLSKVYKVRHYSKKKKKTWYTYYNAGGPYYATPEAKRVMDAVPDPRMPGGDNANENKSNVNSSAPKKDDVPQKAPEPAQKKTTTAAKTSTASNTQKTTSTKTSTQQKQVRQPIGDPVYYTIKSGDTLYGLALKNKTTVANICKLNGISSNATLHVGQKIRLK